MAVNATYSSHQARPQHPIRGAEPIRVVIVDDNELFLGGLGMLLNLEDDIVVVGEAGDGGAAAVLIAATAPDVVLLDVRMPNRSGIEACQTIRDVAPGSRIIMLTASDEEADLISPSMATKVLDQFRQSAPGRPAASTPRLSPRELDVLRLVAQGLNSREIGRQLFISEHTVKNHVRSTLEKLQLHSRLDAVMYAIRERWPGFPSKGSA